MAFPFQVRLPGLRQTPLGPQHFCSSFHCRHELEARKMKGASQPFRGLALWPRGWVRVTSFSSVIRRMNATLLGLSAV